MPVSLDEIVSVARTRVAERKRAADLRRLQIEAEGRQPRGFRQALERAAAAGIAVIAELKKASPSKGVFRGTLHVGRLAWGFQQAGAAALSVLTEEQFFQGSLENLREASAACDLPCLRKDFIVDEFQLLEARAHGGDAVLLLASVLPAAQLKTLCGRARELGLDVLCEVHDEAELESALSAGCDLVGVNSRNLRTFEVDLNTPLRLVARLPQNVFRVAESGIRGGEDIGRLRAAGFQAFLIGELLMRADDPGAALRALLNSVPVQAKTTRSSAER
jgi:indole-3-glycerol phosphate synthase